MLKHIIIAFALLSLAAASSSAQTQIQVRGLIDIVAQGDDDLRYLNTTNVNDSNFDPLRARLFVEGGNDRTSVFLQMLFSSESFNDFRLFGAYLLHKPLESQDLYLEAGLIPIHDGIWAPMTYSDKNPLIQIPLAYYWKSNLPNRMMPNSLDDLLAQKGQGQTGVYYVDPGTGDPRGRAWSSTPMLYDNCWNYGAYTLGTVSRFEYALGVTVGAPGAPVASSDSNEDLALHAKVGVAVTPALKLYLSAAQGAYLARDVAPFLPAGSSVNQYDQTLYIGSADWQWWRLHLMGEVFFNHYETPLRADGLHNTSAYGQVVFKFRPGWYFAARYDELRHEEVVGSNGFETWDENVYRSEIGVGYHVSRALLTKFVVQQTTVGDAAWRLNTVIPALQVNFTF